MGGVKRMVVGGVYKKIHNSLTQFQCLRYHFEALDLLFNQSDHFGEWVQHESFLVWNGLSLHNPLKINYYVLIALPGHTSVKYLATIYCQRDNNSASSDIFFMFFEGWKLFTLLEKKYKCQCMILFSFFSVFMFQLPCQCLDEV